MQPHNRKRLSSTSTSQTNELEQPICSHVEKSVTPNKVKSNIPHVPFGKCCECKNQNDVNVCLKCSRQFCGPHTDIHTEKLNNHNVTVQLDNLDIKCRKCKINLSRDSHSALVKAMSILESYVSKISSSSESKDTLKCPKSPNKPKPEIPSKPSNGIKVENDQVLAREPIVRGLKNTGVICFFNAVLQNLVQTPMLRALLEHTQTDYHDRIYHSKYGHLDLNIFAESGSKTMLSKFNEFLSSLDSKDKSKPIHAFQVFQEMCTYNDGLSHGQQDAQEAFLAILHALISVETRKRKNSVLKKFDCDKKTIRNLSTEDKEKIVEFVYSSRSSTIFDKLFRGSSLTRITCHTCKNSIRNVDVFYELSLPLFKKSDFKTNKKTGVSSTGTDDQKLSKHQKKKQNQQQRKKQSKRNNKNEPIKDDSNTLRDTSNSKNDRTAENGEIRDTPDSSLEEENVQDVVLSRPTMEVVSTEDIAIEIPEISTDAEEHADVGNCETNTVESKAVNVKMMVETTTSIEAQSDDIKTEGTAAECKREAVNPQEEHKNDAGITCEVESKDGDGRVKATVRGGKADSDGEEGILTTLFSEPDEIFPNGALHNGLNDNDDDNGEHDLTDVTRRMSSMELGDQDSLEACFLQFCREDVLSGSNQFNCFNCGKGKASSTSPAPDPPTPNGDSCAALSSSDPDEETKKDVEDDKADPKIKPIPRDATIVSRLRSLPHILVIHIKRFTQDFRGNFIKDRRRIQYPLELDLERFTTKELDQSYRYRLYGVVDHSGNLHRGHYTAYVRKRHTHIDGEVPNASVITLDEYLERLFQAQELSNNKWYFCNDERVSEVPIKKVLNADAYLLFYEKVLTPS